MREEDEAVAVSTVAGLLMAELRSSSGDRSDAQPLTQSDLEMLGGVAAGVPSAGGRRSGALARKIRGTVFRLTRWYVEPFVLQQRSFNLALVRHIAELERRIAELEGERPSGGR